jgi:DNA-binding response OmpR family regulator
VASPPVCPLCRQPLPPTTLQYDVTTRSIIREGRAVVLPPLQWRVFVELVRRRPGGVTGEQLFAALYYDKPDGGPTGNTVAPTVAALRKQLAVLGLHINKAYGWHRAYTLVEEELP